MSRRYNGMIELSISEMTRLRDLFRAGAKRRPQTCDADIDEWLTRQINSMQAVADMRAKSGYDEWGAKL